MNWTKKCSSLLKVPDEPPEDNGVKIPDLLDDANLYEWAGISLGRGEVYRLFLSIKRFGETLPGEVDHLRFFGRINTRQLPYYVIEGLSTEDEENVDETTQEGRNGANKYVYYATQQLESGQWIKLPNVTMEQIVKVRQFKRLLTGNLDADVPSYPPFPGQEKNLLRATIAIIVSETSISPDGFFDLDDAEDPPVVKTAETEAYNERFPKSASDLKESDGWKHHEIELNKIGRILPMPEQLDENGEPIVPDEVIETIPPLENIKPELWSIRTCPGGAGFNGFSVICVRSLRWPGAVAIANNRRYANVYVGNGLPYNPMSYSPPLPASIQSEWGNIIPEGGGTGPNLNEQPDIKVDPTPPQPEGEAEEE